MAKIKGRKLDIGNDGRQIFVSSETRNHISGDKCHLIMFSNPRNKRKNTRIWVSEEGVDALTYLLISLKREKIKRKIELENKS